MATKTKTKARKAPSADMIYVGRMDYCGYELRVCERSEEAAKRVILEHVRKHNRENGGGERLSTRFGEEMTPEEFWEYVGGHVSEMALGKVEWQ